jgi:WD40 repeat protein
LESAWRLLRTPFLSFYDAPFCQFRLALTEHSDYVNTIAFSGDSKTLITWSRDDIVRQWEIASGNLSGTLPHRVDQLAVSAKLFATSARRTSSDDIPPILVWDLNSGLVKATLHGGHSRADLLALSPEGDKLAAWEENRLARQSDIDPLANGVRLWDVGTGQPEAFLPLAGDGYMQKTLAFSADGKTLATGGAQPRGFGFFTAHVWDVASKRLKWTIAEARTFTFSPRANMLASASADGRIRLWDAASGQIMATLRSQDVSWVQTLAFSPDGKALAAAGATWDGALSVRLWNVDSKRIRATFEDDGKEDKRDEKSVSALAFTADGGWLAAGLSTHIEKIGIFCRVHLWDVATRKKRTYSGVSQLAFSPDGLTMATVRGQIGAWSATKAEIAERKTVRLWSVER